MTSVADPQKKLTTTLLLRPKRRLKRGWLGQSDGRGQMFHTIITDWIHAVSPPKKKEKDILKNQVFAEIYHDVVASEKNRLIQKV